jgi:hypothetical protein
MAPTPTNSAPNPSSHGKSTEGPVSASEADEPDEPDDPVFPVDPVDDAPDATDPAAVVAVVLPVVPELEDVVVVVVVVGEDVLVVELEVAAVNVMVTGNALRSTLSEVSSAVYLTDSAVVSLTVKVAIPVLFVVALVEATLEVPPDSDNVTVFPGSGSALPS